METAQWLQGMALSVCSSFIPAGPEVPVRPAPTYHAFHSTLPPRPSSQLLTVLEVGAHIPPLVSAQHYTQHTPSPPDDQSFGLVGVQYPTGPPPGTTSVQLLLLQHSTPTAQHVIYPPPCIRFRLQHAFPLTLHHCTGTPAITSHH